jgi:transcriptional regulator with XRE-family HTH domain
MFPGENKRILSDKEFYGPVGKRFEAFRRVLCLNRDQLSAELNVSIKTIEEIENSETLPDLCMLYYLNKQYGLDINWMLFGHGVVISSRLMEASKELNTKKPKKISAKTRETMEQWELMKVPLVENIIFAKMEEVKMVFKDQIEALQQCRQSTNNGIKKNPGLVM